MKFLFDSYSTFNGYINIMSASPQVIGTISILLAIAIITWLFTSVPPKIDKSQFKIEKATSLIKDNVPSRDQIVIHPNTVSPQEGIRLEKVSSDGVYLTFPGFSTVASIINPHENIRLFKRFHRHLNENPIITNYFALLPMESYHITIINIATKTMKTEEEWNQWFHDHIDRMAETHRKFEQKSSQFKFRIASVDGASTVPRLTLFAAVDTDSEIKLKGVADSMGYLQHVPVQGFHITLGYQYRQYENYSVFPKIKEAVVRSLVEVFGENYQTQWFTAKKPKVCYFHDMKEFIPLETYPAFENKLKNATYNIKVDDFLPK